MSLPRQGASEAGRWQRAQRIGRRWGIWGALLGAIAGLAFNAPAQWLADALHQASGERLLLAQARGSLWDGSAVLVLTGGTGSHDASALPGRLAWQLRPDGLGLAFTARQDCCIQDGLQLLWQPGWRGYTLTLKPLGPAGSADAQPLIG
ncbi:MAG: general secretion pathway protein GspN, partial [Betaproteobacteria bacterium]|nr:general secretion pathway protein GspN [Betaproteobacteria bacterium]